MNKKLMNLLLSMSLIGIDEYAQEYNYLEDQQVNDCLINMYFYMMCNDRDNKEDMYQEFEKRYNSLSLFNWLEQTLALITCQKPF